MASGKSSRSTCLAVDVALSPQSITPFCDFVFFSCPQIGNGNLFHSDRIARETSRWVPYQGRLTGRNTWSGKISLVAREDKLCHSV